MADQTPPSIPGVKSLEEILYGRKPAKKPVEAPKKGSGPLGLKTGSERLNEQLEKDKAKKAKHDATQKPIKTRIQEQRGGKSLAQIEAETPGTYNFEVQRARKILGFTEGSEDDKALKSAMWSAINQSADDPAYLKRLDMAEAYKVIKEFQRAKSDPQAGQAVQERIQAAKQFNQLRESRAANPLPEIAPQTPDMVRDRERQLAMEKPGFLSQPGGIGTPAEISKYAADSQENLKNLIQKAVPNEFAASLIAGVLHAPLNIPSNFAYAGRAGQELSQGNQNFNAADVAGPVVEGSLSALGLATLPQQFASSAGKLAAGLAKLKMLGKLEPSTTNGFVAITKAFSEAGVENSYKVAKQLKEADKAGKLEETVADIEKFLTSDEAKKFDEINQPKADTEIPYRLDERGKPIVRAQAEGRDVNVTQASELAGDVSGVDNPKIQDVQAAVPKTPKAEIPPPKSGAGETVETLFKPGQEVIWRNGDIDEPVVIKGYAGNHGDRDWFYVEGSDSALPLDELMSAESRAAIDELTAKAKKAPRQPVETVKPEAEGTKFTHDDILKRFDDAGLERPAKEVIGDEAITRKARETGAVDRAVSKATEYVNNPRKKLDSVDRAGMMVRYAENLDEQKRLLKQLGESTDEATIRELGDQLKQLDEDQAIIDKAFYKSSSDAGRSLRLAGLQAKSDYSLASVRNMMRSAKGKALSSAEESRIEELTKRVEELENQAKNQKYSVPRTPRASKTQTAQLLSRAEQDLAEWQKRWNQTGVKGGKQGGSAIDPALLIEGAYKMAKVLILKGVRNFEEFATAFRKVGIDLTDEQFAEAIKRADADTRVPTRKALKATLGDLRKEVRAILTGPKKGITEGLADDLARIEKQVQSAKSLEDYQAAGREMEKLGRKLNKGKGLGDDVIQSGQNAVTDPKIPNYRREFQKIDREVKAMRDNLLKVREFQESNLAEKITTVISEGLGTLKAMKLSGDFGHIMRQGGVAVTTRPVTFVRAYRDMFKSSFRNGYDKFLDSIQSAGDFQEMLDAGLRLEDVEGITGKAEDYLFNAFGLVTKDTKFGKVVKVGDEWVQLNERWYTGAMTRIRVDHYRSMKKLLSFMGEPTEAELKAIAEFVNDASGGTQMKGLAERSVPIVNKLLISARYYASRLKFLTTGMGKIAMAPGKAKVAIAAEYGRFWGSLIGLGAMVNAAGGEFDLNPLSTNFGTVKIGDYRFEFPGGLRPFVNIIARTGVTLFDDIQEKIGDDRTKHYVAKSGKAYSGTEYGNDFAKRSRMYADFISMRSNPATSLFLRDYSTGENFGQKSSLLGDALFLPAPIGAENAIKMKQENINDGDVALAFLLNAIGNGQYEKPE